MKLTNEQQDIFDAVAKPLNSMFETNVVIHVDAKAGTGKTALTKYIVDNFPGRSYIYTAFNKKIVEDGTKTFGKNHCKTFHALAYKYISRPNIGGFYPYGVKEPAYFTYVEKKQVVDMLDKYCLSRHLDLDDFFAEHDIEEYIGEVILDYLEKMANRDIPITFNYMLKELHHNLASGDTKIELDMLFVDEAQDLTPVMLEIFGLIQADVKVYLGDTSQAIYSFLDLVSAFTLSTSTYNLTTSFRLSKAIAAKIEPFCQTFIDPTFKITGVGTGVDTSEAFITHSNAEIIQHVAHLQQIGKTYSFTKPVKDIFEVTLAVDAILEGEMSKKPKYWGLVAKLKKGRETLQELAHSEELDDDITNSLKLLLHFKKEHLNVTDILNKAETDPINKDYLIGTAHSVKGLEMGEVTISSGLNKLVKKMKAKTPKTVEDEDEIVEAMMLYYVACSRAKYRLINATELT
ncbi:DEAD/DEAH box helicase [Candidatus Bipolaricaulota bacterium]|nr:DEAD/DEAH box helicase [Candidatus Bipolaricaulota bacterium]